MLLPHLPSIPCPGVSLHPSTTVSDLGLRMTKEAKEENSIPRDFTTKQRGATIPSKGVVHYYDFVCHQRWLYLHFWVSESKLNLSLIIIYISSGCTRLGRRGSVNRAITDVCVYLPCKTTQRGEVCRFRRLSSSH